MAKKQQDPTTPRFGIGEWYGRSFVHLSEDERRRTAEIALAHNASQKNAPACPFRAGQCSKKGGICSLRLYEPLPDGEARPLQGSEGDLRATCPNRFKQENIIYREVAKLMLGTEEPVVTSEIRFLQRVTSVVDIAAADTAEDNGNETAKEDVGNIDNVLVDPANHWNWCALEVQTVYFSGKSMSHLFHHIRAFPGAGMPFPDASRRPDYRSSGPKRLMPQLQIKVPTLRRWGKKMAVVVDEAWFRANVIDVETVPHLSNADIAWCLVHFDETQEPATIQIVAPAFQTLERAVEGLTGGVPVTLPEFQDRIRLKLIAPDASPRQRRQRRTR